MSGYGAVQICPDRDAACEEIFDKCGNCPKRKPTSGAAVKAEPTYSKLEIDRLVVAITGRDQAEDGAMDLQDLQAALKGKTVYQLIDELSDATPQAPTAEGQTNEVKDDEIAKTVNALRDVAVEFHGSQQLRERLAHIVVPLLKRSQTKQGRAAEGAVSDVHNCEHCGAPEDYMFRLDGTQLPSSPVAVPKLKGSPFEKYVPQLLHAAWVDGWASCRDSEFSGQEAMNDAFNNCTTLTLCLNIEHPALPVDGLDAERLTKAQIKKMAVANGAFNAGDIRGLIIWENMGTLGGGIEGLVRAAIALKQLEPS